MIRMDVPIVYRSLHRRRAICLVACVVAIALAAAAWAAPPQPAAEEAGVRAAVESFIAAWLAEDADAVVATFLPDAVAFDPAPPGTFEGQEGIRRWVTGDFAHIEGIAISSPGPWRIETLGPVAWVTGHYRFQAALGEQHIDDEGALTMVWVRQPDGTYRLAVFHASSHPEPPGPCPAGE